MLGTAPFKNIVGANRLRRIDRIQTSNPTRNAHVETEPYTTTRYKSRTTTTTVVCSAHTVLYCMQDPYAPQTGRYFSEKKKRQKMLRESERVSVKKRVASPTIAVTENRGHYYSSMLSIVIARSPHEKYVRVPSTTTIFMLRLQRRSRQGGDTSIATTDRLRNPWWRLREGAEPTSHSASVLQSFDNKFTASAMPPADKPLRETRGGPRLAQQPPDSGAQQRQRPQQASPAGTHLAGTNQRLPSREWVQRRSLPSLLTADANASPSIPSTPAAPSRAAAATAAKRRRGKASGHGEPTGRMQRLDKTATTVADAWGGGASAARHRNRSAESSMTSPATATTNAAVRKQATAALGSVDARESAGMVHHRAVCGTSSGRDLLSSAVSEPLLYVGNGGGGFRLRSF